ncbi:MAG: ABC transporter permease [Dehalococcoidia bacterium]|nr:ABC transporter permease [Dehalococcoidia bacterium]
MSLNRITAIARRVILQLIRDRRTMILIFIVPIVIMTIVDLSFPRDSGQQVLDYIAPGLLAFIAIFFAFILTGVSFLRERTQGTLERLMASPVSRGDIVMGYPLGFLSFAIIQSLIVLFFTIYVLDVHYRGDLWQILIFLILTTVVSINLGIFVSTFARNEFQVLQFIPLVILPQAFLCGLIWPVEQMNEYLQWIAKVMPLTYAINGLQDIMLKGQSLLDSVFNLIILAVFAVVLLLLAIVTLRRAPSG